MRIFQPFKTLFLLIAFGMIAPWASAQSKDCSNLIEKIHFQNNELDRKQLSLAELERRLPQLEKAKTTWQEYSQTAELGMVPAKFNDAQLLDRACKEVAESSSENDEDIANFKKACIKHLQPPIQNRDEAIRTIQGIYSFLTKETEKIPSETAEVNKIQETINDLNRQLKDCEGKSQETALQKMMGQWVNQKGTLIVNLVQNEVGIEGQVVKVPPVWPKVINAGVVFFRSRTNGASPAENLQGSTLSGNCLTIPVGEDCPKLTKTLRYEPCTLTLDSTGEEITLKQTLRKYDPSACFWSDLTEEQSFQWLRVGAPVKQ
jgi:hypothetical protein